MIWIKTDLLLQLYIDILESLRVYNSGFYSQSDPWKFTLHFTLKN